MKELIATWVRPAHGAWIFGSFARGTASSQSDIDVVVVRPDGAPPEDEEWGQQVRVFNHRVSAWSGNDCRVTEFSLEEFTQLFRDDERLAAELRRDGLALTKRRLPSPAPANANA
jgi:predicted nucleotidyltransferase